MNRILLTGASGTVGSELVKALQQSGADFELASSSGKRVEGLPVRALDFNDPASLRSAFAGIDTLFVLLPLVENKVQLARNIVQAAQSAGVRHIVRSSGAGADAAASFALPRLQGEIDDIVAASGIPFTILRPASFMQNFVNFYAGMISGGTLYLPQGEGAVSYIDVRDIAAVAAAVLLHPAAHANQIYTLTGADAIDNVTATRLIGEVLGRTVNYVAVADEAAISSMQQMGMSEWSIGQMMSLNRTISAGHAAATTDTVRQLLGREPITFARFADDYCQSWH